MIIREEQDARSIPSTQMRAIRLDFPRFNGSKVLQWIFQAELFFDFFDITDPYKLRIASIHFEGLVVPWYQMMKKNGHLTSWPKFLKSIELAYGPSAYEDH